MISTFFFFFWKHQIKKQVLETKSFLHCSERVLRHILNLNSLKCTEKELFDACMSWVKEVSGQNELTRQIVNDNLDDLKEFKKIQPSYKQLLSTNEHKNIVEMIKIKESRMSFSALPRNTCISNALFTKHFQCDGRIYRTENRIYLSTKPFRINNMESALFTNNAPCIFLTGFKCIIYSGYVDGIYYEGSE